MELREAGTSRPSVHLYGWECHGRYWHGPTEIAAGGRQAFAHLDAASAFAVFRTRYGLLDHAAALITTVRDLGDSGIAIIDAIGGGAPAAVVAVLPASRRQTLRDDFAFHFTAFLSFLHPASRSDAELAIHGHIDSVLRADARHSIVFAMTNCAPGDGASIAISGHIETVAGGILRWLKLRDAISYPHAVCPVTR